MVFFGGSPYYRLPLSVEVLAVCSEVGASEECLEELVVHFQLLAHLLELRCQPGLLVVVFFSPWYCSVKCGVGSFE